MKWTTVQLGEVIDVKHGFAFKSSHFSDAGQYILLTPGNCFETGGLKLKGDKEKYYTGDFPDEYLLGEGDLVVVMTDLINIAPILGGSFFIPENNRFLHNQRLGLVQITDSQRIDKQFLHYLLNTRSYRAQVRGSASGATVRHTSPNRIRQCTVRIPRELASQRRIADFLSAYDILVENNRRRMALLEDASRQLYEEWFVHLRFPGHEHVPINSGVPKGWRKDTLGNCARLNYGKALHSENRVAGDYPVYGSSGVVGTHEKYIVEGPAIVLGRKGNVGSVFWSESNFYPIDTVYFIDKKSSNLYLYYTLLNMQFINTDVAVPGLNRDLAHSKELLIPDAQLRSVFEEIVTPIHKQIFLLQRYTDALSRARDLLLPRVMSGEIAL